VVLRRVGVLEGGEIEHRANPVGRPRPSTLLPQADRGAAEGDLRSASSRPETTLLPPSFSMFRASARSVSPGVKSDECGTQGPRKAEDGTRMHGVVEQEGAGRRKPQVSAAQLPRPAATKYLQTDVVSREPRMRGHRLTMEVGEAVVGTIPADAGSPVCLKAYTARW